MPSTLIKSQKIKDKSIGLNKKAKSTDSFNESMKPKTLFFGRIINTVVLLVVQFKPLIEITLNTIIQIMLSSFPKIFKAHLVRMRDSYKRFVKTWIRFANPWIRFVS